MFLSCFILSLDLLYDLFLDPLSYMIHTAACINSVAETLVRASITSRLDYCNGVLSGVPSKALDRLQYVQNSAARVLTRSKPW